MLPTTFYGNQKQPLKESPEVWEWYGPAHGKVVPLLGLFGDPNQRGNNFSY